MNQDFLQRLNLDLSAQSMSAIRSLGEIGKFDTVWPNGDEQVCDSRLLWSTHGNARKRTAIVSSRLGRELDRKDEFFRILRVACSQLDPQAQTLLSAEGTATHRYVKRAAELFGIDHWSVHVARVHQSLEQWLRQLAAKLKENVPENQIFVSPPLGVTTPRYPLRDDFVMRRADQVLAIHVRSGGTIESILYEVLQKTTRPRVYLAVGSDELVGPAVAEPLMKQGAIGWYVRLQQHANSPLGEHRYRRDPQSIRSLDQLPDQDRYLTHCTRSANGPWPDQSEVEFLDELILGNATKDRSAFAALMRILGQRRILATSEAIRNRTRVVSLTASPLDQLSSLRRYRAHRGRWDFEPYGIAIDREHLVGRGARKVIYGDESVWRTLPELDRPFFQKLGDKSNSIDWRVEREYRLLEDIDLDLVPDGQALVFVPSRQEAEHVAKVSNWPVVVMKPS